MSVAKFRLYDGNDPRDLPAYMLQDAARYTGVPFNTLRTWVSGRTYNTDGGTKYSKPLIIRPNKAESFLSFTNLIEAHVLNAIRRKHAVAMPRVRQALDFLVKKFGSRHPLAEHDFETDGIDLFVEKYGEFINVSQGGQLAMKAILIEYLKRIERDENGLAKQLFPFTRTVVDGNSGDPRIVSINPRIAFGKPVIAGTGIPTTIIAERYKAGESISDIADDYGREFIEVEEAIRCEIQLQAA
jgi:uncharacterized protein (DUF433 family)